MPLGPAAAIDASAMRYEALIRISNSIRARKEPQELFEILVEELGKIIPFDAIAQFDESANRVNWHLGPACHAEQCPEKDDSEPLPQWVFRTQEAIVLGTSEADERFPAFSRTMRNTGLQSLCAFPLTTAHRRLGSLLIGSSQPNAYSPEEVRFCSLVADQIALATDDAINYQASEKAQARLELLLDLTNRVVSNLDLREVLREISSQVRRVMRCDGVGIDLPDTESGNLRIYVLDVAGVESPVKEGYQPPADKNIPAVRAFQSGEVVIQSAEELSEAARRAGIRSLVHVPMAGREGSVGVLSLGTRDEGDFLPNDLPFLTQVARQVAIAIENARAFGEVSEQKNKLALENLYLEDEIRSELKFGEIVGKSEALRRVLNHIETVAPTDSTVLRRRK